MYEHTGHITPLAPFDFTQTLAFLGLFKPARGTHSLAGDAITQAVTIGDQTVVFRVGSTGTVEAPRLAYRLYSDRPIDGDLAAAAQDRIAFFLSADEDLRPFFDLAAQDVRFAPVARQFYGYHQVKFITPFDNAAWAILSQRVPLSQGTRLKQRVADRYGDALEVDEAVFRAFPTAAQMLEVDEVELAALLNNAVKANRLLDAARHFAAVDEGWLRAAPYAEVETWLRGIKGIGEWSAGFVLLRGLGRADRVPLTEQRLFAAAERLYGRSFTPGDLAKVGSQYGTYQGYWVHYMRFAVA